MLSYFEPKRTSYYEPPKTTKIATYPRKLYLTIVGASNLSFEPRNQSIVVEITNETTSEVLKTQPKLTTREVEIEIEQFFALTIRTHHDILVLRVFEIENQDFPGEPLKRSQIGRVRLGLNRKFVCNRELALELKSSNSPIPKGILRINAVWKDQVEPQREIGEFFYRVVNPGGVYLKSEPKENAYDTSYKMQPDEIFEVHERFKRKDEDIVFVRVSKETDEWMREGWAFETLADGMKILERIEIKQHLSGFFFFQVTAPEGIRFQSSSKLHSPVVPTVHPRGTIFAAHEKVIPYGSEIAYIELEGNFGYIFQNEEGVIFPLLSQFGVTEELPDKTDPTMTGIDRQIKKLPNFSTVSKAVKFFEISSEKSQVFLSRKDCEIIEIEAPRELEKTEEEGFFVLLALHNSGSKILKTADICSPIQRNFILRPGECCFASRKVTKVYEGIGSITFYYLVKGYSGWVIEERFGQKFVEEMPDQIEIDDFCYEVVHRNGARVWNNPRGTIIPSQVLPFGTEIEIVERRVKAEDLLSLDEPIVFLKLKNMDYWTVQYFDEMICRQKPSRNKGLKTPNSPSSDIQEQSNGIEIVEESIRDQISNEIEEGNDEKKEIEDLKTEKLISLPNGNIFQETEQELIKSNKNFNQENALEDGPTEEKPTEENFSVIDEEKESECTIILQDFDLQNQAQQSIFDQTVIQLPTMNFEKINYPKTCVIQWPGPDQKGTNCWSEPDAKEFLVRGRQYLVDKQKYPSSESAYKVLGTDVLYSNEKISHISSRPNSYVQRLRRAYAERSKFRTRVSLTKEEDEKIEIGSTQSLAFATESEFSLSSSFDQQDDEPPFILVLNFILPFGSMVSYYCPRHERSSPYVGDARLDPLLKRFYHGTDEFRGQRLKLIPRCVEGPWVVKKAIGNRPAIVGGKIPQNYFQGEGYFEIELDIATSKATSYIFSVVKKFVQSVAIDMAFVLQGETESELPERVLFAIRYHQFDLSLLPTIEQWEASQPNP